MYFMVRSTLVSHVFILKKLLNMNFTETIAVSDLQSNIKFDQVVDTSTVCLKHRVYL